MAKEDILFDKTEVIITVVSSHTTNVNLTYDAIISVAIEPAKEKIIGIIPVDSEKIMIRTRLRPEPFVFWKRASGEYFDGYKAGFAKFCKDNRVTFYDHTSTTGDGNA